MKKGLKELMNAVSIKAVIILMFTVSLVASVGVIGYVIYGNWNESNEELIEKLADNLNHEIAHRVQEYMAIPENVIELNLGLIENGAVAFEDPIVRNRFFLNTLKTREDLIYSFSYGAEDGAYYGARRNEFEEIELMVNNKQTGGNSWYYSLGENGALGEFIRDFGSFDARTRVWYERAISYDGFSFSPVYKHFVMNDLTVSAAAPVKNNGGDVEGVLGIHILLSGLNDALREITGPDNSYAMIVEKETGYVIANSMDQDNYLLDDDGEFYRLPIEKSKNSLAYKTYEKYLAGNTALVEGKKDSQKLFSMATDFEMTGIDWIVITAIPESLLGGNLNDTIIASGFLGLIALFIAVVVFILMTKKLLSPMEEILQANESFSNGDLSRRVQISRGDEIGKIGESYNDMASRIHSLVNNLEDKVKARTQEIRRTNIELEVNKDRLQLILDSAAEGIYGVDLNGICTFVNKSALRMLGYDNHNELLGKNMHNCIHHSSIDGLAISSKNCTILKAINKGRGTHVDTEVFWTKEGNSLPVEYFSYPQEVKGKIIGGVVTFMDITERKKLEQALRSEKEQFRTTLLSVGDGVISTDANGKIEVMNPVAEKLTGWTRKEALGLAFEKVFHIINEETDDIGENSVTKVLENMKNLEFTRNRILISKKGKRIPIEDSAAPIRNDRNEITGVVVVFRDFTDKKEKLNRIEYLSYHDHLTGLYNRRYMEVSLERLDTKRNLPLTIMAIDVNGLKLTNDAFGHKMGDRLLISCAEMLKEVCRNDDIIGRIGGDEFMILLPQTGDHDAQRIKERINLAAKEIKLDSVIMSLAIGFATKTTEKMDTKNVLSLADKNMYENKLKYGKLMRSQTIELLLNNINVKYDNEQIHTEKVSRYCVAIAEKMGFSKKEVQKIKTVSILHDIGKIMVPPELLNKPGKLTEEELEIIKKHPETGYQILKSVDEYAPLALNVLYHHERMDGRGYPEGLKGEEIPLIARIITVADAYEAMTEERPYQAAKSKEEAIEELLRCSGSQFDSEVVKIFVQEVLR